MVTVTGLTAERMLAIEKASIVSGWVDDDELILQTHEGVEIAAGKVQGPRGFAGPTGTGFWVSRTPMWTGETTHVIPIPVPGLTIRVGDVIMSTDPSTVGFFGRVINVISQTNVTVSYLGNLGGGGNSIVEPGTMVWKGDYDAWEHYRRGDMVKTPDGIFVGLSESQGEFPSLPVDPFADTFDREEIGPEWQVNSGWVINNGRAANDPTSSGYKALVKTNLTSDGQIQIRGFNRHSNNDGVCVYVGWVDNRNHYRIVHSRHNTYIQSVIDGEVETLTQTYHVLSNLPTIVVTKSGFHITVQMGQTITEVEVEESINGSGWGVGYNQYMATYVTGFGTVDSVEFTPAQSDAWSVVSSPTSLGGLSDVLGATPSHGDVLSYDSAASRWVPTNIDGVEISPGGEGSGTASRLDELLDVDVEDAVDGQTLTYDAATEKWTPQDSLTEVFWKDVKEKPDIPEAYTGPPIIVSETEPTNPTVGMIWVDLSNEGD